MEDLGHELGDGPRLDNERELGVVVGIAGVFLLRLVPVDLDGRYLLARAVQLRLDDGLVVGDERGDPPSM